MHFNFLWFHKDPTSNDLYAVFEPWHYKSFDGEAVKVGDVRDMLNSLYSSFLKMIPLKSGKRLSFLVDRTSTSTIHFNLFNPKLPYGDLSGKTPSDEAPPRCLARIEEMLGDELPRVRMIDGDSESVIWKGQAAPIETERSPIKDEMLLSLLSSEKQAKYMAKIAAKAGSEERARARAMRDLPREPLQLIRGLEKILEISDRYRPMILTILRPVEEGKAAKSSTKRRAKAKGAVEAPKALEREAATPAKERKEQKAPKAPKTPKTPKASKASKALEASDAEKPSSGQEGENKAKGPKTTKLIGGLNALLPDKEGE
jgi:hypothetical protein